MHGRSLRHRSAALRVLDLHGPGIDAIVYVRYVANGESGGMDLCYRVRLCVAQDIRDRRGRRRRCVRYELCPL